MSTNDVVKQALESELSNITLAGSARVCVGFSGGVDSTVLLHAAAEYCAAEKRELIAIHVHHGLSKNADHWAQQAKNLCSLLSKKFSISIACIIERVQLDECSNGIEQSARQARYQVFEKHCQPNDVLLQGHHLDDQLETFFMRAMRGSGLTGLSSIPGQRNLSRTHYCQIVRPLLSLEKASILDYANQNELNWVEDESNLDNDLDRNWWRNELLPLIWQRYPAHKQTLNRTIKNVQHEHDLLQRFIAEKIHLEDFVNPSDENMIHPALVDIPHFNLSILDGFSLQDCFSYVRAWLAQHIDILPSAIQMQSIYIDLIQAREDSDPCIEWSEFRLRKHKNFLFLLSSDHFSNKKVITELEENTWQGSSVNFTFGELTCIEEVNNPGLKPGGYVLRFWQDGDVAKPNKRATRKIKKWFQDFSIPNWARHCWPIIVDEKTNTIAAVPGLFVCQGYQVEPSELGWFCSWKVNNLIARNKIKFD